MVVLPRGSARGFLARSEGWTEKTKVVVRKLGLLVVAKTRVMYVIRLRGSKEVPPYRVCTCVMEPLGAGKDTGSDKIEKKTSAGYSDPCSMQGVSGDPKSPVRAMGSRTSARIQAEAEKEGTPLSAG